MKFSLESKWGLITGASRGLGAAAALLGMTLQPTATRAQSTAFTYQGRLAANGSPANGTYDMTFTLLAASNSVAAQAGPVTNLAVNVTNGLFSTAVDFGANAFTAGYNWLGIGIATNGAGVFVPLSPRQFIAATPYAQYAANAALAGAVATTNLTGSISDNQLSANVALRSSANTFTGNQTINGAATFNNGLTVAQKNLTLTQGSLTSNNGNIVSQQGSLTLQSGNLTLDNGGISVLTRNIINPIGQISALTLSGNFINGTLGQFSGPVMINATNYAVGSAENLRIIRGQVNYNGTIAAGSGFTVSHLGTGVYVVTFQTAFASPPVITSTAINNSADTVTAQIGTMSATSFAVGTHDNGLASDQAFTFIAIGN